MGPPGGGAGGREDMAVERAEGWGLGPGHPGLAPTWPSGSCWLGQIACRWTCTTRPVPRIRDTSRTAFHSCCRGLWGGSGVSDTGPALPPANPPQDQAGRSLSTRSLSRHLHLPAGCSVLHMRAPLPPAPAQAPPEQLTHCCGPPSSWTPLPHEKPNPLSLPQAPNSQPLPLEGPSLLSSSCAFTHRAPLGTPFLPALPWLLSGRPLLRKLCLTSRLGRCSPSLAGPALRTPTLHLRFLTAAPRREEALRSASLSP